MKLIYNGKEIDVKYGMREEMLFEEITKGRTFNGGSLQDCFYMFWGAVQVALGEPISFEDFSKFVDDEPQKFADYIEWLASYFQSFEKFEPKTK